MARKTYKKTAGTKRKSYRKGWGGWVRKNTGHVVKGLGDMSLALLKSKLGLNTEIKYIDQVSTNSTSSTTLAVSNNTNTAALIAQGNTTNTRNGDTIRMTKYAIRGQFFNQGGNLIATVMRVIIVNWLHTPYSNANTADILETPTDMNSKYTKDPKFPHRILLDKLIRLGPYSAASTPSTVQDFEWSYEPLNHHIVWTTGDTTGAQANVLQGSIQLYTICNNFTAGNAPSMTLYQRVEFVDN